jgi:hypothetical protein
MGRNRSCSPLPKRILIVCEGESEQIYLNGLKKDLWKRNRHNNIEIEMYQPNDFSPIGIVNEARKKVREARKDKYPYASIWVVFDKDAHAGIDRAFSLAENNNPKIDIAFSNVCFEYWVLLHFEKTSSYFRDSHALISCIETKHHFPYNKTMNIYEGIKHLSQNALENADWLKSINQFDLDAGAKPYELNAYTDFHELFQYIQGLL